MGRGRRNAVPYRSATRFASYDSFTTWIFWVDPAPGLEYHRSRFERHERWEGSP